MLCTVLPQETAFVCSLYFRHNPIPTILSARSYGTIKAVPQAAFVPHAKDYTAWAIHYQTTSKTKKRGYINLRLFSWNASRNSAGFVRHY